MGEVNKESTKISYSEFCNKQGVTPHVRFYLSKLYKDDKFTESEWKKKIENK